MPSCAFRKCTNYDSKVNKAQGISYHTFPKDEVRLEEWIAVVREQRSESDWVPSKRSRICNEHFKSSHKYVSTKGLTLLHKDAVPIIEERNKYNDQDFHHDQDSLPLEVILESPIELALRKRVRLLTFQKKQLQKRNQYLAQRNKTLKEKMAKVAIILKHLKAKNSISETQFTQLMLK